MYTMDYFINKFSAIPEDQWCIGVTTDTAGRHDVWGHCGEEEEGLATDEGAALFRMVAGRLILSNVNDGEDDGFTMNNLWGATPRKRIIAALVSIKKERPAYLDYAH